MPSYSLLRVNNLVINMPSNLIVGASLAVTAFAFFNWILPKKQKARSARVYVRGQIGMEPGKTELVPGGARAEAKQAMTNIGEHLAHAGASFNHVTTCNIMVANMSDIQDVDETFKSYFSPDACPARNFFQKDKLPKNALVMIDAEAVLSGQ